MKIIIFLILIIIFVLFFTSIPLSPYIKDDNITFRWLSLKKQNILYIDDNKDFSTPIIRKVFSNKYSINIEPGEWYWKLDNNIIRKLNINSKVSVKVNFTNITNDGNVKEILSDKLTTFAILNPKQSIEIKGEKNVSVQEA